ncbi:MAG TPA: hypothetical protein VML36_05995 [Nitrospiria bacterium]|nr:hypothetical protein [Nitrospiria bacterium]
MPTAGPVAAPTLKRPLDLTIFGVLFLFSAPMELWNIMRTHWEYTPKFFGIVLTGVAAKAYLAAQPLLHLALGYGFLTMRRWALYLALIYAADVLTSTVTAFLMYGYGRFRTIFLVFLTPFVVYVIARRRYFVR